MEEKKILIVDNDSEVRDILNMMVTGDFQLSAIEAESGNQAIDILKNEHNICIILSDFNMPDGNGSDLYQYVKKECPSIPFILISMENLRDHQTFDFFSTDNSGNGKLNKPFSGEELASTVSNGLKEYFKDNKDYKNFSVPFSEKSNFYRIKLEQFGSIGQVFSDTSIKISESKYLKAFSRGDHLDKDQIERYKKKGVDYLYQEKKQVDEYIEIKIKALINKLDDDNLDLSKVQLIQLNSIEQVRQVVQSLGVRDSVIELTEKISSSITKNLKKNKSMKSMLDSISTDNSFFFEHSHIVNYLCASIADELSWDDKIVSKLIFASIFCDMELKDPKLAIVYSLNGKTFNNLKRDEKSLVKNHMNLAITKLDKTYQDFSTDEKNLILNHHEHPGGGGFIKGLNEKNIPPLSTVFNLSYEFGRRVLLSPNVHEIDCNKILMQMGPGYSKGNFEEAAKALRNVLNEK